MYIINKYLSPSYKVKVIKEDSIIINRTFDKSELTNILDQTYLRKSYVGAIWFESYRNDT